MMAASSATPLDRFYRTVHTLTADFTQVVYDADGKPVQRTNGRMWIARPDKFRWDYRKPYEQHIVSDGHMIWIYDVGLEQVTERRVAKALGSTPALLLAGKAEVRSRFEVRNEGVRGGLDWYLLIPKKRQEDGFDKVRLAFSTDGALKEFRLTDGFGQHTDIRLENVRENKKLSPALFTFEPPPNVDVIRQ